MGRTAELDPRPSPRLRLGPSPRWGHNQRFGSTSLVRGEALLHGLGVEHFPANHKGGKTRQVWPQRGEGPAHRAGEG